MISDIPLVTTQEPLVMMKRPTVMQSIPMRQLQMNKSRAICLNNRVLTLYSTSVVKTSCKGQLCDKIHANEWKDNTCKPCGCISTNPNNSNLAMWLHTLSIEVDGLQGLQRIAHDNFSSSKFSLCYLSHLLSATVNQSNLSRTSNHFMVLKNAIRAVINHINGNGGWTAVCWAKQGCIKDKSLINAESTTISRQGRDDENNNTTTSGEINYHIIELLPTNTGFLDRNTVDGRTLDALKFDVSLLD